MVISQQGIAATSQALASQAGAQTLAEGGSAADAAIAANANTDMAHPIRTLTRLILLSPRFRP